MFRALYTSASGMKAQQMVVDTTANNLANVNTTGFKRSQIDFQDLLYVTLRAPGTDGSQGVQIPTGLQIGSGVKPASTTKIFTEGVLQNTNNELDLAIAGDGFFRIRLPNGEYRYTRDGAFRMNSDGALVNSDGYFLDPQIQIPADTLRIEIGADGTVNVITASSPESPAEVGRITLVRFANPAGLSSEGDNLYARTAASGPEIPGTAGQDGFGTIRQGFLERSNVEVVSELVNLITAQRAYEINSRAIRIGDEMLAAANNMTT